MNPMAVVMFLLDEQVGWGEFQLLTGIAPADVRVWLEKRGVNINENDALSIVVNRADRYAKVMAVQDKE